MARGPSSLRRPARPPWQRRAVPPPSSPPTMAKASSPSAVQPAHHTPKATARALRAALICSQNGAEGGRLPLPGRRWRLQSAIKCCGAREAGAHPAPRHRRLAIARRGKHVATYLQKLRHVGRNTPHGAARALILCVHEVTLAYARGVLCLKGCERRMGLVTG